jgi:hypothetical protein
MCARGGNVRTLATFALIASLLSLTGCWGHEAPSTQAAVSIALASSSTIVTGGNAVTVSASVYDQTNQGVTWSLSPMNFGVLSNSTATSVTYTAPTGFTSPTTVTITAISVANPNVSSSVQISVSPIIVSLTPPSPQTLNPGGQIFFGVNVVNYLTNPGVIWTLNPASGAGSIVGATSTVGATYAAPAIVSAATTVTLTATSLENSAALASVQITLLPSGGGPNVAIVNVNGGPVPGQTYINGAFTTITICNSGSTTACQTVDGVLVDTGSYGLRILQSQIPFLKINPFVDGNGNILENCASSPDGSYLWGPVAPFDIYIAGEVASSSLAQVISSSIVSAPDSCSNGGTTNDNTPLLLGANGILGVGPEPTDCTVAGLNYCDGSVQPVPPNLYYTCPTTGCASTASAVIVEDDMQVTNPVSSLTQVGTGISDNNGVILQLPAVTGSEAAISGTMIFGIGTETNNQLGAATVFTLDSSDNFTTLYNGQSLTSSFIDSGSNALYFPDVLPVCTDNPLFYCPSSLTNLSATNEGATQGQNVVSFSVDSADNLFTASPGDAVFDTLAGPQGTYNSCSQGSGSCTFDWGLPFFFGRTVYTAIDGNSVGGAPASPWWAY